MPASRWLYTRCDSCGATHKTRAPRRVECKGNCGRWWFTGKGRVREWCDRCYPIHRSAMRNGRAWPVHLSSPLHAAEGER